jgi:hypothetical protein
MIQLLDLNQMDKFDGTYMRSNKINICSEFQQILSSITLIPVHIKPFWPSVHKFQIEQVNQSINIILRW